MAECHRHTVGHPTNQRQGGMADKVLLTQGRPQVGVVPLTLVLLRQACLHYHLDLLRMTMMMMLTTIRITTRIRQRLSLIPI